MSIIYYYIGYLVYNSIFLMISGTLKKGALTEFNFLMIHIKKIEIPSII